MSALVFLLKVSNFVLIFALPVFLLSHELHYFVRIFILIAGVIQGTEETERLVFDGIFLSAES